MWHITLPGIRPTIIVLLIMSIGGALNVGMETPPSLKMFFAMLAMITQETKCGR